MTGTTTGDDDPDIPDVVSVDVGKDGSIRWSTSGPDEDLCDGSRVVRHSMGVIGGNAGIDRRSDDDPAGDEDSGTTTI